MYVKTPILSTALVVVPDVAMLREHWESSPAARSMSFERYMERSSMGRDQYNMSQLAHELKADARTSTCYPAVATRIAAMGIVMSIPAADGSHVTVQRAYHGQNEGRMIEAFARIFLSPIEGTDMAAPPFVFDQRTIKYPTLVTDGAGDPAGVLAARAMRHVYNEYTTDAKNERFVSAFLRQWYNDDDKWSQNRPNYRMKYNPYVVDASTMFANDRWSGPVDLAGQSFGLDMSGRPPRPPHISADATEEERDNAGQHLALDALWRARRSMELYCIQTDIVRGTNYMQTLVPSLTSAPLTPGSVPDDVRKLKERYAEDNAAGRAPSNIAVLRHGAPLDALDLAIVARGGRFTSDVEKKSQGPSTERRKSVELEERKLEKLLLSTPEGNIEEMPLLGESTDPEF